MFLKNYLLLVLVLLLSSCVMPFQPSPQIPDISIFQEGDIVITADGSVESWFFALAARSNLDKLEKPYSHAEMVFLDNNNHLMIGGVFSGQPDAERLVTRFHKFQRIAVFRAKAPLQKRKKAALTLKRWLNDSEIRRAGFDYSMSYEPGRTDKLFCAGIVNDAYQSASLISPFGWRDWEPNGLTRHVEEILGRKLNGLLDLSSIYLSNDFVLVLEWENNQTRKNNDELSKEIVLYMLHQYEKGFRLKTGNEFNLFLAVGNPLERIEALARLRISLARFRTDIVNTWERLSRKDILKGLNDNERNAVLNTVFEKYHEKYFYSTDTAVNHDLQLHITALSR